uniref:Uncharacterized protein n=1 Tax=Anguilla anguilla TaxID=7936 RepID=A0A0E9SPB1_ANGAN
MWWGVQIMMVDVVCEGRIFLQ